MSSLSQKSIQDDISLRAKYCVPVSGCWKWRNKKYWL
ncbi:UNVERIFIED_CONTAM: hypothetical protein GTU68_009876 [Idotea baltica]|nr:hypothetical protein [Idotea baltica]